MKITTFNSSPRGRKSNTNKLVEAFLAGAKTAGAEVESILLVKKKIKHCMGCLHCWVVDPGRCIIKDDMAELIEKAVQSDIMVMATPLYADNVSGIMKNFMDRMLPMLDPRFEIDEKGVGRHVKRYEKLPNIVALSNCGLPEPEQFQVLRLLFRRLTRNMQSELTGEIYRASGPLLEFDHPMINPLNEEYLKNVRLAGEEIVATGKISGDTQKNLDRQLVPTEMFLKGANKNWERLMAEAREKRKKD